MLLMLIRFFHFTLLFICVHGNTFILLSSLILYLYSVHWPTAVTTTCFNYRISRTYLTNYLCLLFNITHLSMFFCLSTMWASSCKTSETVVEGVRLFALITNHRSVLVFHRSLVMGVFSPLSTCFPWSEEPDNRCPVYELIPRKKWSQRSLQEMLHIVQGCRRE